MEESYAELARTDEEYREKTNNSITTLQKIYKHSYKSLLDQKIHSTPIHQKQIFQQSCRGGIFPIQNPQ